MQRNGIRLRVETAEISLIGARESNQDRVASITAGDSTLAVVCDGMGGHSAGERAAEIATKVICDRFADLPKPLFDPLGFLNLALGVAHQRVVQFGLGIPVEVRPRATCALCLVQDGSSYWGHIGDSRIYLLRRGRIVTRTRDHSHVELLLREGLIEIDQMQSHPMRNFVESCIGGEALLPEMTLSPRHALLAGDILLVCTDGLWGNLNDESLAGGFFAADQPLARALATLAARAVEAGGAAADNTSAIALRCVD